MGGRGQGRKEKNKLVLQVCDVTALLVLGSGSSSSDLGDFLLDPASGD